MFEIMERSSQEAVIKVIGVGGCGGNRGICRRHFRDGDRRAFRDADFDADAAPDCIGHGEVLSDRENPARRPGGVENFSGYSRIHWTVTTSPSSPSSGSCAPCRLVTSTDSVPWEAS